MAYVKLRAPQHERAKAPSAKHTLHARRKKEEEARRKQAAQADAASKKGTLVNERWFTLFIMDVIKRRKMLCICFNAASL
jgi:hypothetical protein